MDGAVRVFGFAAGIVIVLTTASSLFTTLVIPRMTSSRLLRSISRWLARVVKPVLGYLPTYEAKDRIMALVGPLAMVLLFGAWVLSLVVGFGLMIWWASGSTLASSLAIAGSSIFTLGIATAGEGSAKVLEILSAGFGLLVVALEIAYLPALYSAFSEREAEVTLLATRAGVPAWGPEVLA